MATMIYYSRTRSHLSLQSSNDTEDHDGSSSGELLRGDGGVTGSGGRSSSSQSSLQRRWRSYGDVAILPAGGADGAQLLPHCTRHVNGRGGTTDGDEHAAAAANYHVWTTDEHAAEAYFHVSAVPGYVSLEDVIGAAALYRDGSGRPLEAAISDPLLRTASRLYARENNGRVRHCRRQPSPGPLGTRRGSTMHAIVKLYVRVLCRASSQASSVVVSSLVIDQRRRLKPTV